MDDTDPHTVCTRCATTTTALTGVRDYLVTNSINIADLTGAELNRTWQLDQLHYGTFLTPFVGLRYVKFKDYYRRDKYCDTTRMVSRCSTALPPVRG